MTNDPTKPCLLLVDDEQPVLNTLNRHLRRSYEIRMTLTGEGALEILKETDVAVLIVDQRMPGMSGTELLAKARGIQPDAVRILLTGYSDIEAVVLAVNNGNIFYYIHKPWEPDELEAIVHRAVERYRLVKENQRLMKELDAANQRLETENQVLRHEVERQFRFDQIIGDSAPMQRVFALMRKVIPTDTTILLEGETGTGKELVARAIHQQSPRQEHLFVAQDCGALPDTLLESELFGHAKGAFTDAVSDKKGLFEIAHGGTIFLDEITDTTPAFQQRLLRVLQEREIRPLGSNTPVKVDVRIISASRKPLEAAVEKGTFREDLFYRINVFPIILPSLKERRDDIPQLAEFFVEKYAHRMDRPVPQLTSGAREKLMQADFPGNVRQLENIVERALVLAEHEDPITDNLIQVSSGKQNDSSFTVKPVIPAVAEQETLRDLVARVEKQAIEQILEVVKGNIQQAAKRLGLSRLGLYKKMERMGIDPSEYKIS